MQSIESGTLAGIGSFRCATCDFVVNLANDDALPRCPGCGGTDFVRASLFGDSQFTGRPWPQEDKGDPGWVEEVREGLDEPGEYLAYERAGETRLFALSSQWTRIGRSLAADIRFDDPTVSRRHALIVRGPDGVKVLDDRSLNGVFVNGERVEWRTLEDGDEVVVGCHSLRFLELSQVAEPRRDESRQVRQATA
ncbi:MAG TPA: FHA domain-containing protein [Solirubrobacteraceae bacterium]|nr:FHA domain-containing protein [Solirubrobacteraceae bacterium]